MKFDPYSWNEVKTNAETEQGKGKLWLRLSAPCPLYITAQGYEALAGIASEFDLDLAEEVTFRVEAPKAVRAFLHVPASETCTEATGETFTNIDRMPHESGMVAEVTRARRQLELERRAMLRDIRAEAAKARASLKDAAAPAQPVHQGEAEGEALVDEQEEAAE